MSSVQLDYFKMAITAFENGQYETTISYCEKARLNHRNQDDIFSLAGRCYLVLSKLQKAEEYFTTAIKFNGNNGQYYFDLANSLFGQERFSAAAENYLIAQQKGLNAESTKKMYYLLGLINQTQGNNASALMNYKKSESIPGTNMDLKDIWLQSMKIYMQNGELDEAEQYARKLKLLMPDEYKGYQLLFQILIQNGDFNKAGNILSEAEKVFNDNKELLVEIEFNKVLLSCVNAEADTGNSKIHYQKALTILDKLTKSNFIKEYDQFEAYLTMSEIYLKLENFDQAIKRIVLVGELDEMRDEKMKELIEKSYFLMVEAYKMKVDYEGMIAYSNKLITCENAYFRYHGYYYLAFASKKLNNNFLMYDAAIAYYKTCTMKQSEDYIAHLLRIKCYADIGKVAQAKEFSRILPEDMKRNALDYIENQCNK